MTARGRAARRDAAEKPIVDALRAAGRDVTRISGPGAPDLLVRVPGGREGLCVGMEIKGEKGKRTEAQEKSKWPIVRNVDEALEAVGVVISRPGCKEGACGMRGCCGAG